MKRSLLVRRVLILAAVNLLLALACLSETTTPPAPATHDPSASPTPTQVPPTSTPTPTPETTIAPGTVVEDMTVKHETLSKEQTDDVVKGAWLSSTG